MALGYTRTGKTVKRPARAFPGNADDVHRHVEEKLSDWAPGDHTDASRILAEHAERETDREIGAWCAGWAAIHRALGEGNG